MFEESGKLLKMLPGEIGKVAAKFLLPRGEIKHTFFLFSNHDLFAFAL